MYTSEDTVLMQSSLNFARMFISIISRPGIKVGHVRSKSRSKAQILEKQCELPRRHIFDSVFTKLNQNVYLYEIYVRYETKSHWVKNKFTRQSSLNFAKMFVSIISRPGIKVGHVRSKTRS